MSARPARRAAPEGDAPARLLHTVPLPVNVVTREPSESVYAIATGTVGVGDDAERFTVALPTSRRYLLVGFGEGKGVRQFAVTLTDLLAAADLARQRVDAAAEETEGDAPEPAQEPQPAAAEVPA